jgi:hypothetical protein
MINPLANVGGLIYSLPNKQPNYMTAIQLLGQPITKEELDAAIDEVLQGASIKVYTLAGAPNFVWDLGIEGNYLEKALNNLRDGIESIKTKQIKHEHLAHALNEVMLAAAFAKVIEKRKAQ